MRKKIKIKVFKNIESITRDELIEDIHHLFKLFSYDPKYAMFLPTIGYLCLKLSISYEELNKQLNKKDLTRAMGKLKDVYETLEEKDIGKKMGYIG